MRTAAVVGCVGTGTCIPCVHSRPLSGQLLAGPGLQLVLKNTGPPRSRLLLSLTLVFSHRSFCIGNPLPALVPRQVESSLKKEMSSVLLCLCGGH